MSHQEELTGNFRIELCYQVSWFSSEAIWDFGFDRFSGAMKNNKNHLTRQRPELKNIFEEIINLVGLISIVWATVKIMNV